VNLESGRMMVHVLKMIYVKMKRREKLPADLIITELKSRFVKVKSGKTVVHAAIPMCVKMMTNRV